MRRQGDEHRPRRGLYPGIVLGICGTGKTGQHHEGSEYAEAN
jgi:hypothetical protein